MKNILDEAVMTLLSNIQSNSKQLIYAETPTYKYSSAYCRGSCYGTCDSDCSGSCEYSCSGDCSDSCR